MPGHAIVHIDISAKDLSEAGAFYGDLFGWKSHQPPGFENYRVWEADSGPAGGFMPADGNFTLGSVLIYVSTDDIDATLAKAASLGGKTVVPKTEIPNVGWFGVFTDPSGNHIGLFTGR